MWALCKGGARAFIDFQQNLDPVFFKLFESKEEIIDQYGNPTGSYIPIYGELKSAMLCVSPNKGNSEVEQFGSTEEYDKTMTTSDPQCPIDENAVLWVDGADTDGPWNYTVKMVARWKDSTQYAIKKVTVSQYNAEQKRIMELREQQTGYAKARARNAEVQDEADA